MICDPAGCVLYEHFHASLSSFVLNLCHVQNVFHVGYYEYRPNLLYFICTDVYKGSIFFVSLSTGTIMKHYCIGSLHPPEILISFFSCILHYFVKEPQGVNLQLLSRPYTHESISWHRGGGFFLLVLVISVCYIFFLFFQGLWIIHVNSII